MHSLSSLDHGHKKCALTFEAMSMGGLLNPRWKVELPVSRQNRNRKAVGPSGCCLQVQPLPLGASFPPGFPGGAFPFGAPA